MNVSDTIKSSKVKKQLLYIIVFIISSMVDCYSQSKILRFEHINTETGLPKNQVFSIFQDEKGFIWCGTGEGLSRYDGHRFITYNSKNTTLSGNDIFSILEDSVGDLWVGTNTGISKFDKSKEQFENFSIDTSYSKTRRVVSTNKIIENDSKSLWVATVKGLYLLEKSTGNLIRDWSNNALKKVLEEQFINTVYKDSKERVWVGTNTGAYLFNKKSGEIRHFINDPDDTTSIVDNAVSGFIENSKGIIWVATGNGLCKLSERESVFEFEKIRNPFQDEVEYFDMIGSLAIDESDNLWIGYLNGLYYLPEGGKVMESIEIITDNPLIRHNYAMVVGMIDQSKVLWLTSTNGIYKHDLNLIKFKTYRANQDHIASRRQNMVWSILKDSQKRIWLGTSHGLHELKRSEVDGSYEYNHIPRQESEQSITTIFELDEQNLLITTADGLFKFNKESKQFSKIPINVSNVSKEDQIHFQRPSDICWGKDGEIWIGTHRGLLLYNPLTKRFKGYKLPSGPQIRQNNRIDVLQFDRKNRLWIGTHSGINVFLPEEEKGYHINFSSDMTFSSVWTVYTAQDDSIWFATWGSGLYHILPKGNALNLEDGYDIEEYHVKDGLANEYIYAIIPDKEENLWMSTNMGLSKFYQNTKTFENYTVEEGLQSNEFNSGAFNKGADGEIFFGGPSGVSSFYSSEILKNEFEPEVVITGVKAGSNNLSVVEIESNKELELGYEEHPIKIEFASLSFNNTHNNVYKVLLENYDDEWTFMGNQSSVTYTKLPAGKYVFKVRGTNGDGKWSSSEARLALTIKPPFWMTIWFYMICILVLMLIIYLIFKVRIKQIKLEERKDFFQKKNEEKITMLKEIHHRVKNNLQVVVSLLRLQSAQLNDEEVIRMFKEAQRRIISMALLHEKMYRSEDLRQINVKEHVTELIVELVKSYKLTKKIDLEVDIDELKMGIETLIPLGLIINELITNSLKYAFKNHDKGIISISLKEIEESTYEMILKDNGIGYELTEEATGLGTKLITIFIKQLEGSLEKLDDLGTSYKVKFFNID